MLLGNNKIKDIIPEEWSEDSWSDWGGKIGELEELRNQEFMVSSLGSSIKSALVSGVLTAILAGAIYVLGLGDVFAIDVHALVNVVALGLLTSIVSFIKSALTTNNGRFMRAVQIK